MDVVGCSPLRIGVVAVIDERFRPPVAPATDDVRHDGVKAPLRRHESEGLGRGSLIQRSAQDERKPICASNPYRDPHHNRRYSFYIEVSLINRVWYCFGL